jgi:iron(III) transport system ATP-binding protein
MAESEIGTAVRDVLHMVGLGGYDRQFPNQLSGGEQQRVALARATVIRPRVLLFDEPLSNLDAKLRVHMRGELQQLQKQLSITAVYVTHDQEEAMAISDRIVVMSQGAIAQEGTAESLYRQPASEFVAQFIGRTNLLTARVLSLQDGGTVLELRGMRLRISGQSPHAQPGQSVRLVVRPEVISIERPDRATGLPGTVASRMFLGEKVEYHVRMDEDLVQVTSYNPRNVFASGEAVTLTLPTDGISLLPGGTT